MSKNKLTRDEKTNLLMAKDIISLRKDLKNNDYVIISAILKGGDGWQQYDNMKKKIFEKEFYETFNTYIKHDKKILALAHVLNGKPIDLLKV